MEESSNKALLGLITLIFAVSVFSTYISLHQLGGLVDITGRYASQDSGTVNLTISSTAYINVTDNWIDFKQVDLGWKNWSEQYVDFFEVRNDGSVDINISIYATNNDTGLFASSTMVGCPGTAVNLGDDGKCIYVRCNRTGDAQSACTTTFSQVGDQYVPRYLIWNLSITQKANISVNITVPSNEPAGANKQGVMTIYAITAG